MRDAQRFGQRFLPPHPAAPEEGVTLLTTIGGVRVMRATRTGAVLWKHGLNVDADGAPHAYSPTPGQGLDYLADAGHHGDWWGIVTDNGAPSGNPVVQDRNDPAPGFYISDTSLGDDDYPQSDPGHWVNASQIPFIVLPENHSGFGGALGDYAAAIRLSTGKVAYAIAADEGSADKLGEGSIALAEALGLNPSPKDGGTSDGIAYLFFPGSGDGKTKTVAQINAAGARLLSNFGGVTKAKQLLGVDGE